VNPVWNSGLVETTQIGTHVFYRFPNRAERATYQEALARRLGSRGSRHSADDALIPEADDAALDAAATTDAATTAAPPAATDASAPADDSEVAT
jgi:hypothetical protein